MSFIQELKRRNVFKVGIAYVIVGWLILQAGEVLAPALHLPEWVNSALAFFLLLGFPLALFFAWAFEMTPEGIKKERNVDRSKSIAQQTGQKINLTIIGLLVVTLGYFAYDKFMVQPQNLTPSAVVGTEAEEASEDQFKTIAVLPFVNMSDDSSNEYFSDGLTEELLNILAKIKELRVAGRTSSFAFKDQNDDLRVIGEKLGVKSILEGSVRKDSSGTRVRITVQLINVEDGYHLWSETYDRELKDIFAIQDDIAHEVALALRVTLLGEDEVRLEQVASTPINAYDLYLQGLQGLRLGGFEPLNRSVGHFQQALALDAAYTPAKLGLINTWSRLAQTGAITRSEAIRQGLPPLETILSNQPDNSEAHIQLALLRDFEGNGEAAERAFITALELDPRNAGGLQEYGRFLFDIGQTDRGMQLIDAAVEIEPYDVSVLWDQAQTNAIMQNLEVALSSSKRIRKIEPDSPLGYYGDANAHFHTGNMAQTLKEFTQAIERDPDDYEMLSAMAQFRTMLSDVEQAAQWQHRADAKGAGQPMPIFSRIMIYEYREQHELAQNLAEQVLDRKIEDRYGSQNGFRNYLTFEAVRTGNYQTALKYYRELFPWAFETMLQSPDIEKNEVLDIIQLAGLLKLAEPMSDRSEQLLLIADQNVSNYSPRYGLWFLELNKASIAVIRGDNDKAIDWLNEAWDKKWRFFWRYDVQSNAVFKPLANEPDFQALISRFESEMDRQRQQAYVLLDITK